MGSEAVCLKRRSWANPSGGSYPLDEKYSSLF